MSIRKLQALGVDCALFWDTNDNWCREWTCMIGTRHPYVRLGEVEGIVATYGHKTAGAAIKEALRLWEEHNADKAEADERLSDFMAELSA